MVGRVIVNKGKKKIFFRSSPFATVDEISFKDAAKVIWISTVLETKIGEGRILFGYRGSGKRTIFNLIR